MVRFLNRCAKIEETAAEIYQLFSARPCCDHELSTIWQQMAQDEGDHARQLKLAQRLLPEGTFDTSAKADLDLDELENILEAIRSRCRQTDQSLLDMLKDAVLLENLFRKVHATCCLTFKNQSLLDTFNRLARADAEHLQGLDAYLKRYKETVGKE